MGRGQEPYGEASDGVRRAAPDSLAPPASAVAVTVAEYKFPATRMADVLPGRDTELWAALHRPAALEDGRAYPLLVFLHGNHGTCGRGSDPRIDDSVRYTTSGACPAGYTVTPNHRGYDYIAERLAARGYLVVSINANRGITGASGVSGDSGLNLARGRLILKHLETLAKWNEGTEPTPATLGVDLRGHVDFEHVGLMGHSRGGEGARAAYNLFRDAGSPWPARIGRLDIRAILEIGPVDGQTSRTLDADGTAWSVLLPMCDGDVSSLQGMLPFDRMLAMTSESRPTPKSTFAVLGANHNFYNTEWQENDSDGCSDHAALWSRAERTGSAKQRTTGLGATIAFFAGHVGVAAERPLGALFSPDYAVPGSLSSVTGYERSYVRALGAAIETFTGAAGKNRAGLPIVASGARVDRCSLDEHESAADCIEWTRASATTMYELPFDRGDVDTSRVDTLLVRVARETSARNTTDETNFHVALVDVRGSVSAALPIADAVALRGPLGHVTLPTASFPLDAFGGIDRAHVKAMRFFFDDTASGKIALSDVRFGEVGPPLVPPAPPVAPPLARAAIRERLHEGARIAGLATHADGTLTLKLHDPAGFAPANALYVVTMGASSSELSAYTSDDTRTLEFTFPAGTPHEPGSAVTLRRGAHTWHAGTIR